MIDNYWFFLLMIFMHIMDDYRMQGILASMKQQDWWKDNAPDRMYKHDYIAALFMHSFSWTFMIMLPVAANIWFDIGAKFVVFFFGNLLIHGIVDDLKANRKAINLCVDQAIHMAQILITWIAFFA